MELQEKATSNQASEGSPQKPIVIEDDDFDNTKKVQARPSRPGSRIRGRNGSSNPQRPLPMKRRAQCTLPQPQLSSRAGNDNSPCMRPSKRPKPHDDSIRSKDATPPPRATTPEPLLLSSLRKYAQDQGVLPNPVRSPCAGRGRPPAVSTDARKTKDKYSSPCARTTSFVGLGSDFDEGSSSEALNPDMKPLSRHQKKMAIYLRLSLVPLRLRDLESKTPVQETTSACSPPINNSQTPVSTKDDPPPLRCSQPASKQ